MILFFWENAKSEHSAPGVHPSIPPVDKDGSAFGPQVPLVNLTLHHEEGKPATAMVSVPKSHAMAKDISRGRRGKIVYRAHPWEALDIRDVVQEQALGVSDSGSDDDSEDDSDSVSDAGSDRAHWVDVRMDSKDKIVFYGHLVEVVEKEHVIDLLLVADLFSLQEQWEKCIETLRSTGTHHELWNSPEPENLLACIPYVRYWDRSTGALGLSHARTGSVTWDLSQCYDPKYRVTHKKEPVSEIKMDLVIQWEQKIIGYANIAPEIARCFPQGVMGTLTDRALESGWPETGRTFASGYFVSDSSLRKITDSRYPNGIVLRGAPQGIGSDPTSDWVAECSFYQGRLVVGYLYRQKRKEIVTYTLHAALADSEKGKQATITLNVPDFARHEDMPQWHPMGVYHAHDCVQHEGRIYQYQPDTGDNAPGLELQYAYDGAEKSMACWKELPEETKWLLPTVLPSFFSGVLGQEIFTHSLERAKTALVWGTRCIDETVRGSIRDFYAITLDDTIVLQNPQNISEKNTGKVVAYTLHMDVLKNTGYVEIRGAFSVAFQDSVHLHNEQANDRITRLENPDVFHIEKCQDITYAWPKKEPMPDLVSEKIGQGICKNIVVKNHIQDQLRCIKKVQEAMHQDRFDPEHVQSKETRITLQFHSLNTKECLEHTIAVNMLSPFVYRDAAGDAAGDAHVPLDNSE